MGDFPDKFLESSTKIRLFCSLSRFFFCCLSHCYHFFPVLLRCSEDDSRCDYMGMYAFSKLDGRPPEPLGGPNGRVSRSTSGGQNYYLMTGASRPFCAYHHRVTIVLSDTPQSTRQGGDRSDFAITKNGNISLLFPSSFIKNKRFPPVLTLT